MRLTTAPRACLACCRIISRIASVGSGQRICSSRLRAAWGSLSVGENPSTRGGFRQPVVDVQISCGLFTTVKMTAHSYFTRSYQNFDSDPRNLVSASIYGATALCQYEDRILASKELLFIEDDQRYKVPIRDISSAGTVTKINIKDETTLCGYLGEASLHISPDRQDSVSANAAAIKEDHGCRFVYVPNNAVINVSRFKREC